MKLKASTIGMVVAAAVTLPVIAHGSHGSTHSTSANNLHPVGTSIFNFGSRSANGDGDDPSVFANWFNRNHQWYLDFGNNGTIQPNDIGVRIEVPNSKPTKNFSMDINVQNGEFPVVTLFGVLPGNTVPESFEGFVIHDNTSGVTYKNIGKGYERLSFSSAGYGLPAGTRITNFYFFDQPEGEGDVFNDTVTNVVVDGIKWAPNVQPYPEYDSTAQFL